MPAKVKKCIGTHGQLPQIRTVMKSFLRCLSENEISFRGIQVRPTFSVMLQRHFLCAQTQQTHHLDSRWKCAACDLDLQQRNLDHSVGHESCNL